MYKNNVAFVVATKDRPKKLRLMLKSLENQSYRPDQIIIVDGGTEPSQEVIHEFPSLSIAYFELTPPSATKQRNAGIKKIRSDITLAGFLDDDVELEVDAVEKLMEFWQNAPQNIAGVALNMVNHPAMFASSLKRLPFAEYLGLYSKKQGTVLSSAFHTMIGKVKDNTYVDWLPTGATVWRKEIFKNFEFDEWFTGYSYLEDLDFSYFVGKRYRLMVLGNAKYYHNPGKNGRESDYKFGLREVENRLYFEKKHQELSPFKCYLALLIRTMMNFSFFIHEQNIHYFQRTVGNLVGLVQSILSVH